MIMRTLEKVSSTTQVALMIAWKINTKMHTPLPELLARDTVSVQTVERRFYGNSETRFTVDKMKSPIFHPKQNKEVRLQLL